LAYFSCPQLEAGSVPNRANFLVNGDFRRTTTNTANANYDREFPDTWTKASGVSTAYRNRVILSKDADLGLPAGVKGNALQLYSRPTRDSVAFGQKVYVKGVANDVYIVGGWVNSNSVAAIPGTSHKNAPCIAYRFIKSDDSATGWKYLEFNRERVGWQFACWPIVANVAHEKIEIHVNYARNSRTCWFT